MVLPGKKSRESEYQSRHFLGNNKNIIIISAPSTEEVLVYGHANSRGCAKHILYENKYKVLVIEFYERLNLAVTKFANFHHLSQKYHKYLSKGKDRLRKPNRKKLTLSLVSYKKYKHCKIAY